METCIDLPELTLNVKDDQNEVFLLLELIKPTWKKEEVTIKALSGGYSCCMLRCCHESGESLTVRVRNNFDGLKDPEIEQQVVKAMSSKGYFSPVLAVFQNGYCYEYIPGIPVVVPESKELAIDENKLRHIAQQMACIHSVVIPSFDYSQTSFYNNYVKLLSTAKPWFEGCPSMNELTEEVRMVQEFVSVTRSPLVTSHGDPHPANLVWNEDQNKLTFVDWEGTQVAPRGCDVATFVISLDNFGHIFNIPVIKPVDFERKFCKFYLQKWNELQDKNLPTSGEIDQLLLEIKYFKLVVKLNMLVVIVKFDTVVTKLGDIDSFWKFSFEQYLSTKEELLGIKTLGLPSN